MPTFRYEGRDPSGATVTKKIKASSMDEVVLYLSKHNIIPLQIDIIKQDTATIFETIAYNIGLIKIDYEEIMSFCRQLSTLLKAGVPIIKSLNQLSQSSKSRVFGDALSNIADNVAAGQSFSDALQRYPKIFSKVVVSIIEVGENTGHLNEALMQISGFLETYVANKRRLVSTARYPIIVLVSALIAMIVMNIFVIPKFAGIFARYKLELPLATRIIVTTSTFMSEHWLMLLIIFLSIIIGLRQLFTVFPFLRYYWDKYKLSFPVVGNIQKRIMLSQFCWTFGLVLKSGLSVLDGISLAGQSTGNAYFIKQINIMRDGIGQGQSFSVAAINSNLFFPTIIQMIEVGEETGKLDEILTEVSHFYEGEIDYDIRRLNELMEPILLVMVGGIVLVMAIGIYFPLWDLIKIAKF